MEVTFKYKDKIFTTPNLEKKLKRMKISIDDIEIIPTIKKSKTEDSGLEEYILNKRKVVVRSTKDDIRRICYIPKDYRPTIRELFINQIWNSETKTGIKGLDEEMLMTMYYEE